MSAPHQGPPPSAPRRVLLVGAGHISEWWLRPLLVRADVTVVGIVDLDHARAARLAAMADHDIPVFTSARKALDAAAPSLVVNLTPPQLHREICEVAFEHRCDVFVEKPLSVTLADCTALRDAARRAGVVLAVMQNRRFHPAIALMRRTVAEGALGRILHVCVDMFLAHPEGQEFLRRMPHPVLSDMSIHHFDAVRAVTGLRPCSVNTLEWTSPSSWMEEPAGVACSWRLTGGAAFSYRASWIAPGLPTSYDGTWRIGGTLGSIGWDGDETLELETWPDESLSSEPSRLSRRVERPADHGHAAALASMLDALNAGHLPETHVDDNLQSISMVFAAVESARSGDTVTLRSTP